MDRDHIIEKYNTILNDENSQTVPNVLGLDMSIHLQNFLRNF